MLAGYNVAMNRYLASFFGVMAFVCMTHSVSAATLYMSPSETEIYPGDTLAVEVRLNTDENECVNVVDGVIEFDANIVPVDISRGNSIVPIWVEDPVIDLPNKRITFAGGIPNGYCGRIAGDPKLTNIVLEILFQAPAFAVGIGQRDDIADITFSAETGVYLNDGTGSLAPLQTFGSQLAVAKKASSTPRNEWTSRVDDDDQPPQVFSITLSTDPSIYNGKYFVTFNTTDKQSGIDHYEIIEEPIDDFDLFAWGAVDAPWTKVRSPYLLKDQSLNSTIRVKAVDKAGNEYIAVYVPEEELRGTTERDYARIGLFVAGLLIILVSIGSILFYRFTSRRLGSGKNNLS